MRGYFAPRKAEDAGGLAVALYPYSRRSGFDERTPAKDDNEAKREIYRKDNPIFKLVDYKNLYSITKNADTAKRFFQSARQIFEGMLCALRKNLTKQCGKIAAGVVFRVLNTGSKCHTD